MMQPSASESLLGSQRKQPKGRWIRLTVTALVAVGIFLALVAFQSSNGSTAPSAFEQTSGEESVVGAFNQIAVGGKKDKKSKDADGEDIPPKKDTKKTPWYKEENWGAEPECKADGKKGEPTLKTKGRYMDVGWVCGKKKLTLACDSKPGMDIDTVFVVVRSVQQHKFTGGLRTDEAKQLNSVTRSMRITRKCNSKDRMKTNKNRCEINENDFAQGEDNTNKESKKRRYLVKYECHYGKRNELPDDYEPVVASGDEKQTTSEPEKQTTEAAEKKTTEGAAKTTQEAGKGTTQSAQKTTQEAAKRTTQSAQKTTQEAAKGTTQSAQKTTQEAAKGTTQGAKQTTQPPAQTTKEA